MSGQAPDRRARRQRTRHAPPGRLARDRPPWPRSTSTTIRLSGAALVNALKDADVIVLMRDRTPFTAALLAELPKLRYLVFTGTRNAKLDLAALAARNIPVSCTEFGPSKDSTCELTWATILAATKQLETHTERLKRGPWRSDTAAPLPGTLAGPAAGRDRSGRDWRARRQGRQGFRHGRRDLEPAHDAGARRDARRRLHAARGVAGHLASRQPAPGRDAGHAAPAERRTAGADAARQPAGQHLALGADRHRRARVRAASKAAPASRRWTCSMWSPCRWTTRCAVCPTCC